ncbi:MAG TPA: hypothetical protein VL967_06965 [Terracidiphilus sp.]|nr:hypothetical protein [Terracidiphilus sp.]
MPVIPMQFCPDPGVAADWLIKAFGFTVHLRIGNHRIQMWAREACFTDHPYGGHQYDAEDFFGHRWSFTEALADLGPESRGGTPVDL